MTATGSTPLRGRGLRTAEGWVLVRDASGKYDDGVEAALTELFASQDDLGSRSTDLVRHAEGAAQAFQVDADRANVVRALDLPPDAVVLEIGAGLGAVTRYLGETVATVDAIEPAVPRARAARARTRDLTNVEIFVGEHTDVPLEPAYDAVVVVGVLEYVGAGSADPTPYVDFLRHLAGCLKPGGTLAVAIENKLGVKYLVGAPEDHTDVPFDGIEDYPAGAPVRTFSRAEIEKLFAAAGLVAQTRVAFPDYKLTRVVMDPTALPRELVRNLPSFPSADLRSPRPHLADERLVWQSFVEAGLAQEVGNSFLVLGTAEGRSPLWPDDVPAVYFARNRSREYTFTKRVVRAGDGLRVECTYPDRGAEAGPLHVAEGVEPFVPGPTLLELAAELPLDEISGLLAHWRDELVARAAAEPCAPVDFVPNNIVVVDGELVAVDQEFCADGWPVERVLRRGVLWFAAMLARSTTADRWDGFTTVRDIAVAFGRAVDLDPDGAWIETALDEEAEFFAEIGRPGPGETEADAQTRRAALASMVGDRLTSLSLGERLPAVFERVRGYLADSERQVRALRERLAATEPDRELVERAEREALEAQRLLEASEQRVSDAEDRARSAEQKVRSAEASEAFARERIGVAERRYADQAARAEAADARLAGVRGSRAYRLATHYYRFVERVAPGGSLRRRLYAKALRETVALVRRGRPRQSVATVSAPLVVPLADAPLVSIVVPVYGKWAYTEQCLRALAATAGNVPFEVVVVDDASPDDSAERLRGVEGIRVVTHKKNRGYVRACNSGITAARGAYVVLLNNDTRVQPGWLDALTAAMGDPTIGLVGARLVYPDGRLQEAGGLIFADASGWNYGRYGDPEDPAYTYTRDVDYCSGACIMLRRSTLMDLGMLDERFAPAYYDDADLAFGVRSLGLRVVYEPRAVVVHDEGVSSGTDVTAGVKKYQVRNQAIFREKWATELASHPPMDPCVVQRAARRRQGHGIVVVIDHYVPRPDEDAGSVRMFGLLHALRQLGYAVLFVPDNRHRSEPYTARLQAMGIEVLYGGTSLWELLAALREDIVAVIAARVTVASTYLIQLRSVLPDTRLLFDTIDLHFLREEREAHTLGKERTPHVTAVRELELAMVRAADSTLVVSSYEKRLLESLVPGVDVRILPTVHERQREDVTPDGRDGLLFVGSFAHQPNADALRWFTAEILPLVERTHPGIPVRVVGRDPLPDLVNSAPSNVSYLGWVEDLTPLYARARVVIAPLRYGAGIKGKIGEAMVQGVPVVTTPVGAEGMELEKGKTAMIASSPQEFADAIARLTLDDELWQTVSGAARRHVEEYFGTERFVGYLAAALNPARPAPGTQQVAGEAAADQPVATA